MIEDLGEVKKWLLQVEERVRRVRKVKGDNHLATTPLCSKKPRIQGSSPTSHDLCAFGSPSPGGSPGSAAKNRFAKRPGECAHLTFRHISNVNCSLPTLIVYPQNLWSSTAGAIRVRNSRHPNENTAYICNTEVK